MIGLIVIGAIAAGGVYYGGTAAGKAKVALVKADLAPVIASLEASAVKVDADAKKDVAAVVSFLKSKA
jgi:hypothetical protein